MKLSRNALQMGILAVSAGLFAASTAQAATSIGAFDPPTLNAKVGDTVKLKLNGDFDGTQCGLTISFSDGQKQQRVRLRDKEKFPLDISTKFDKPGTYKVTAEGGVVGSALSCLGKAEATVVVAAPAPVAAAAPAAAAAAAPACPTGYALVQASVKKTGEFTCAPKKPETKIACPTGLRYFEQGANVGCRK
jgi:plastocyanin